MGKRHENHPLEDKPFVDDFVDWMGSHEGQLSTEVSDVVWMVLKEADVDAKDRKIIWQDRQRLSFAESVKRIHADYPDFAIDLIEDHLIGWLEMGFAPPSYSQEQLDELDQLTGSGSTIIGGRHLPSNAGENSALLRHVLVPRPRNIDT